MIIENSNIHLSAEHEKTQTISSKSSHDLFAIALGSFENPISLAKEGSQGQNNQDFISSHFAEIKERVEEVQSRFEGRYTAGLDGFLGTETDNAPSTMGDIQTATSMKLFDRLMEIFNGRQTPRIETEPDIDTEVPQANTSANIDNVLALSSDNAGAVTPGRLITVNMTRTETVEEYECSKFHACGTVQTADGETIDLDLNLEMSRSYKRTTETVEEVLFKDPLIINFDGNAAELTEESYEFDIDADGELDIINFLGANSSLLALDQNADGVINDGSELFGAISGDGFADLANYDEDGNGWIDEADSIFDELLLWRKVDGEDQLNSLADQGVGAIYLNAVETPFDLHNDANEVRGQVKQSGVYLAENGQSGTVQQIDLAV